MTEHLFRLAIGQSNNQQVVDEWVQHVAKIVQKIGGGPAKIDLIDEGNSKFVTVASTDYVQHLELMQFFGPETICPPHAYPIKAENMNDEWWQEARAIITQREMRHVKRFSNPPALTFLFLSDLVTFAKAARELDQRRLLAPSQDRAELSRAVPPQLAATRKDTPPEPPNTRLELSGTSALVNAQEIIPPSTAVVAPAVADRPTSSAPGAPDDAVKLSRLMRGSNSLN